jgi:hypothetical protein
MTMQNQSFVLALIVSLSWLQSQPCSAVLVGHWTGDGTANDATGNGHDGTLFGDVSFTPGVVGDAFLLDGNNDYIAIANDPSLESTIFSVAAFVRMPDTNNSQRLVFDSSHGFLNNRGWALQTETSGAISILFGNGSLFQAATSTTLIDDNDFHHIAGVVDASTLKIYVDGSLEDTFTYTGGLVASGREVRIGAAWGGVSGGSIREVNGIIDDVRYYDHALSSSQVQSLANVPEPSSALAVGLTLVLATFRRRKQLKLAA